MFFQESTVDPQETTKLPQELFVSVMKYVSRTKRLEARLVCRELRDDIDNCGLVWEDAGADDRADFIERMKKLPSKY